LEGPEGLRGGVVVQAIYGEPGGPPGGKSRMEIDGARAGIDGHREFIEFWHAEQLLVFGEAVVRGTGGNRFFRFGQRGHKRQFCADLGQFP